MKKQKTEDIKNEAKVNAEAAEEEIKETAAETEEAAETEKKETAEATEEPCDKKKDKKEEAAQEKIAELNDKYMRQLAEFENYRKRTEKEKSAMFDMGATAILSKFLPTVDNFERAMAQKPESEEAAKYVEGIEMVYKGLLKNLEEAGVKPIEAVGQKFNPDYHNAVMHEEDDSGEENIITEEFQKGYMYKQSVLRTSMVKVKN